VLLIRTAFEAGSLSEYIVRTWGYSASLAITSAAISLFLVEIWGISGPTFRLIRRRFMVLGDYLRRKFDLGDESEETQEAKPVPPDVHNVDRPPKPFRTTPPGKVRPEQSED
jgi:hypothetical protein